MKIVRTISVGNAAGGMTTFGPGEEDALRAHPGVKLSVLERLGYIRDLRERPLQGAHRPPDIKGARARAEYKALQQVAKGLGVAYHNVPRADLEEAIAAAKRGSGDGTG